MIPKPRWFHPPGWLLSLLLFLPGLHSAPAAIYTENFAGGFANSGLIPDGNPSGWQNSQILTYAGGLAISDLAVTLEIQGGWNGDLYLTLRHETAAGTGYTVLLNRVGTPGNGGLGYGNSGFGLDASLNPFRLSDAATHGVHYYQDYSPTYNSNGQLTGAWKPDGSGLASFHGLDPSGTWTLFAADLNGGDVSTVVRWGLEITAVPEPVSVVLVGAGALLCQAGRVWRRRSVSNRMGSPGGRLPASGAPVLGEAEAFQAKPKNSSPSSTHFRSNLRF